MGTPMNTVTALCHREFRMMLEQIAQPSNRYTLMENELATLALSLYDANPEHPAVVHTVNSFTRRALDEPRHH
jgi:hypothetical protein